MQADLGLRCSHMPEETFSHYAAQLETTALSHFSFFVSVFIDLKDHFFCLFVLRFYGPVNPMGSYPNGVISSAASLPNHTFTGQA